MKAQAAAASTSGVVRVPHIPVGADVSSSAAASEAITDTSSVAGAWASSGDSALPVCTYLREGGHETTLVQLLPQRVTGCGLSTTGSRRSPVAMPGHPACQRACTSPAGQQQGAWGALQASHQPCLCRAVLCCVMVLSCRQHG